MPADDHLAWVDDYDPPYEMTCAAFTTNGTCRDGICRCATPGCPREATMVAHRIPYDWSANPAENPGKTSVENLVPVCADCKLSASSNIHLRWLSAASALLDAEKGDGE